MTTHPEHALQVKVNQWVRECVPFPHMFFSVDRAKQTGRFTHARQKNAGFVAGTPDTVLLLPNMPAIAIELKAYGEKPEPGGSQEKVGVVIKDAGHLWGWCDSVVGYCALLRQFGVLLGPYAALKAEHHDLVIAGAAIKRQEAKTGVPSKKRTYRRNARDKKPTEAQIRKAEAMRSGSVRF